MKSKPFWGIFAISFSLLIFVGFWDYNPAQCPIITTKAVQYWTEGSNSVGCFGVYFTFWAFRIFGYSALYFPVYILWAGLLLLFGRAYKLSLKKLLFFLATLVFLPSFFAFLEKKLNLSVAFNYFTSGAGGICGEYFFKSYFKNYLGSFGSGLLLFAISLSCLALSFVSGIRVQNLFDRLPQGLVRFLTLLKLSLLKLKNKIKLPKFRLRRSNASSLESTKANEAFYEEQSAKIANKQYGNRPEQTDKNIAKSNKTEANGLKIVKEAHVEKTSPKTPSKKGNYVFPDFDLLQSSPPKIISQEDDFRKTASNLVEKLAEFGVEVKVQEIHSGPVITRYEITPAKGVRVEKIVNLEKNIALGLKALSVRIQAPVPGKGCVGIEIPNERPNAVCLKDILESKAWSEANAEIPIVLGKEVTGTPIVTDLTKMPHLLIAGSTGAGKTVCINAIIASLLYHSSPEDLRFIMVDPKIVEMKIYNDLPHMLIPVVTDPKKVPGALKWLIGEMEARYNLFAKVGVRNIAGFNAKVLKDKDEEAKSRELERSMSPEERNAARELQEKASTSEQKGKIKEKMPYIVCIIDELADLMMVAPADIETCIARLAQLARAAGIHLIIATQRPSVNVITGVIKANLPSRIAFKVASKVDSRTILDLGGADSLIGKGDMLFIPPGSSQLIRAQGALVSDEEIQAIVEKLKINGPPTFSEEIQNMIEFSDDDSSPTNEEDWDDDLIPQAIEIIKSSNRASTSLLQRRLKIGYNRAARMMETLEEKGIVGPDNGSMPRQIVGNNNE